MSFLNDDLRKRGKWQGVVRGLVVRFVDLESLVPSPTAVGSNPARGLWFLSCEEDIQLAYGTERWCLYSGARSCL